jgi:hypothetical protein
MHRPTRRFATAIGLLLGVGLSAGGQPPTESFDDKLKKAAEVQAGKSQVEDAELKRLLADSKARREAGEKQAEADLRQAELAFKQKREQLRREEAEARKELEARLAADGKELSAALAELRTRMAARGWSPRPTSSGSGRRSARSCRPPWQTSWQRRRPSGSGRSSSPLWPR